MSETASSSTGFGTAGFDWAASYATRAGGMKASEIRELLKLLDQPDVISFAGGIPDPALFPADAFRAAYDAVLSDPRLAAQALQYSVSEGYAPLRAWIVEHMASFGVPCSIDNIVITCGSQQGLDFLGKLFLSPGDTALVTSPTYLGALQAFKAYEPQFDDLSLANRTPQSYRDRAAAQGGRVKFAYLVPDFQNPTGITVTEDERRQLLTLADELNIPVIEDAAYQALRFAGTPVPSVLALDIARSGSIEASRTIYCGTFSKTIVPALRIGWICAARPVIQKLVLMKQAGDLHVPTINQIVMHRVAEQVYDRQIATVTRTYAERRDLLLAALERHMPAGVEWTRPEGGMFVWVTLPAGLDGAALLAKALERERVAFVPGKAFYADGAVSNVIRLSFSLASADKAEEGIARLGRVIRAELARQAAA